MSAQKGANSTATPYEDGRTCINLLVQTTAPEIDRRLVGTQSSGSQYPQNPIRFLEMSVLLVMGADFLDDERFCQDVDFTEVPNFGEVQQHFFGEFPLFV